MDIMDATATKNSHWQIIVTPAKGGLWLVLLMAWTFAGGSYALWWFSVGQVSPLGHLLIFAFPILVSYYGVRGLIGDNGKLVLQRDGFRLTGLSGDTEFFQWDKVERFSSHIFGDAVVTGTGIAAARFTYAEQNGGQRIVGLANSLPYAGDDLAQIMEYARIEASKGWPEPPQDLIALAMAALGHSYKAKLGQRLEVRSTGTGTS